MVARLEALAATELTVPQRRIVDDLLHTFRLNGVALEPEARRRPARRGAGAGDGKRGVVASLRGRGSRG